jgi:hypothetical protein
MIATWCILIGMAATGGGESPLAEAVQRHTWQVWPEVSRFEYKEPGIMTEKGFLMGLGGSYTYRFGPDAGPPTPLGGVLLKAESRLSVGQVDYDGSLMDGTPYSINGIDDWLFELRTLAGREYPVGNDTIVPYLGLGYRYLRDDMSTDPSGYDRESSYFYLPVGAQYTRPLSDQWSLEPRAEIDMLLVGRQISHLGDADPTLHTVANHQTFGYGLRGSLGLQRQCGDFALILDPFITYWNVNDSSQNRVGGSSFYEPSNWSLEYGLRFIVKF